MTKILVTGLCLSRNLGGPAMGLTLVDQLRKHFGDALEFKFAVSAEAFEEESRWAEHYGLKAVRRDSMFFYWLQTSKIVRCIRGVKRIVRALRQRKSVIAELRMAAPWDIHQVHKEYLAAFQWADLVIDMSGISYVGDGVASPLAAIHSYSSLYYSQRAGKPFARFIQSFGPFDNWLVRYVAKKEFAKLPFIPARGNHSAEFCRRIVADTSKVHAFPDSAILLPANFTWATDFLKKNNLSQKEYVIVSPSAVIHASIRGAVGGSVGSKHVEAMAKICMGLIERGEQIVFLPHMYSQNLRECDRQVARLVAARIPKGKWLIVEEDIDPMMAKGLIATSKYAIVSRYHALVAALSTGVDVITVGWNIKYQDMMEYYGKERYAVDMRQHEPQELADRVRALADDFGKPLSKTEDEKFRHMQKDAEQRVHDAFKLLFDWMENVRPHSQAGVRLNG
ncbi:MAG: polysaccharide pyruvyl transferase family protein [Pirellulaceae bacterium]|nr:polysaccharide pyruvyl transferase family protein [Pirellulaceae bacterium]